MATVSERLLGDHSSPEMMATVIGLLKELEDDRIRDPNDRFDPEELAEIADSAKIIIRLAADDKRLLGNALAQLRSARAFADKVQEAVARHPDCDLAREILSLVTPLDVS